MPTGFFSVGPKRTELAQDCRISIGYHVVPIGKECGMKRVAIIGGETHIAEITRLAGSELEIVGAVVPGGSAGK